jgi:hypothetical protein
LQARCFQVDKKKIRDGTKGRINLITSGAGVKMDFRKRFRKAELCLNIRILNAETG